MSGNSFQAGLKGADLFFSKMKKRIPDQFREVGLTFPQRNVVDKLMYCSFSEMTSVKPAL